MQQLDIKKKMTHRRNNSFSIMKMKTSTIFKKSQDKLYTKRFFTCKASQSRN